MSRFFTQRWVPMRRSSRVLCSHSVHVSVHRDVKWQHEHKHRLTLRRGMIRTSRLQLSFQPPPTTFFFLPPTTLSSIDHCWFYNSARLITVDFIIQQGLQGLALNVSCCCCCFCWLFLLLLALLISVAPMRYHVEGNLPGITFKDRMSTLCCQNCSQTLMRICKSSQILCSHLQHFCSSKKWQLEHGLVWHCAVSIQVAATVESPFHL